MATATKTRGKGWHGDPRGHARAGALSSGKFEAGNQRTLEAAHRGGLASPTKFKKGDLRAKIAGQRGGSR